jgi:hypothetical protein
MRFLRAIILGVVVALFLVGCDEEEQGTATPGATAVSVTAAPDSPVLFPVAEPARYRRLDAPLVARAEGDETAVLEEGVGIQTGVYRVEYVDGRLLIRPEGSETILALTLPGGDGLNMLDEAGTAEAQATESGEMLVLNGRSEWGAEFQARVYAYNHHPGLLRWRLEIVPGAEGPTAGPEPELQFVDANSGEESSGQLEIYAERAPMAAPHLYGYSGTLDSTLFYWVDLTALNPFMENAHYTPSATPRRQGQRVGHNFSRSDLAAQPGGVGVAIYDSYLYLEPGEPADEDAMFTRYLYNLGDIYDLMAVPDDPLVDWFAFYEPEGIETSGGIDAQTIASLADEQNWVTLDGKWYLRAYVADTRESAEAITQLDVFSGLARYEARFNVTPAYMAELRATVPDFFNPDFGPAGMFQNSGPISVTGAQGRGDTWYELGHALKVAELALIYPQDGELRELALRSGETWIDFAHSNNYLFPRFYSFDTWEGTEREPDAGGGYAYYMLLLHDLTGESHYIDEARNALQALEGFGFRLAYETHMTAITAAAAARLYQLDGDAAYLALINRALANLLRLSWLWECDYGWMGEGTAVPEEWAWLQPHYRTFFGLNPTQQSAVVTPKEQYEAWIYLTEMVQRAHGALDPTVEKLAAEFVRHSLLTTPLSLPPLLPEGAATANPAAYETVSQNDLSLMIPLEDMRDGWDISGAIGQEVYGAGMAPAMAAVALVQVTPSIAVYSGYPVVVMEEEMTVTGVIGTFTPVVVIGASGVEDSNGEAVAAEPCGRGLCFTAEGGKTYRFSNE